jgi:predicted transposase YdaD
MKSEKQPTLHDHFFKESMEHIVIAQGFAELLLPLRLTFDIDYNSLQIEKDSWINALLKLHCADILYRAKTKDTRKNILLLFEHKSSIDKSVAYQNYHNTSEVLEEELMQKKTSKKKLPPVIPVIIYHGEKHWNADNSLIQMFEVIKGAEKFIPQQKNIVIDLGIIPDKKIKGISEVRAFVLALKYSRSPLLFEKIPEIVKTFSGVGAERQRYLDVVMTYLKYATPESKRAEFSKIAKRELELGDENMKKFSSIWEELGYDAGKDDGLKEGKRIGLKKGEDIGLKKGEDIGLKKGEDIGFKKGVDYQKQLLDKIKKDLIKSNQERIALKMLRNGIGVEKICDFTGLSIEEVFELKKKLK